MTDDLQRQIGRGDWAEPAPAPDLGRIRSLVTRRRRRRTATVTGAGLACAAVVGAVLVLAPSDDAADSVGPADSTRSTDGPLVATPCTSRQLLVRLSPGLGNSTNLSAEPTEVGHIKAVEVGNTSGSSCRLERPPELTVVAPDGTELPLARDVRSRVLPPDHVYIQLVEIRTNCPHDRSDDVADATVADFGDGLTYRLENAGLPLGCGDPVLGLHRVSEWWRR